MLTVELYEALLFLRRQRDALRTLKTLAARPGSMFNPEIIRLQEETLRNAEYSVIFHLEDCLAMNDVVLEAYIEHIKGRAK